MAAARVPIRTLQEWLGHRDIATTQIYADYAPSDHEQALADKAFQPTDIRPDTLGESATAVASDS